MISRFFIDRPIFASVLSIVITLLGAVALFHLPLTQYPPITPPTIRVSCFYPGASAKVLAETVAAPIEQQVNGVEDMLYMSSQCTNDGNYSLSVTFKPGVDLNFAQVLVQNRVNLALPSLPDVVRATGVTTRKRSPDILLLVSVNSPDGRYDQLYLSNYANMNIKEELARVDGVGDVILFSGQEYAMRVWVDPERLAARRLTAADVVAALREQNVEVAAGQIGYPPAADGQNLQLPIKALGRLQEPEEFEQVVIRATPGGPLVRLKDVGRVELGAKSSDVYSYLDGKPCANIAVFQLPDANALETAERVRAKMEELRSRFPDGVTYDIVYDTTPFVRESVNEVFKSLRDSIILVALVVLVFLQSWRSAVIPLLAVPVAIVGTFAVMAALGFSLNNLTLFGLVLSVGIVVDDAIVVVEAVEHHIEHGLSPRDATIRAMSEVSGPVIAVGLVLGAVFVPCAFITGITGQFFRQFALTIAVSTLISTLNSLTLSPALCAILLKPRGAPRDFVQWTFDLLLGWLFRLFNSGFRGATGIYTRLVALSLRGAAFVLLLYGGLVFLTWYGFQSLPSGYIPPQDGGRMFVSVQLPEAASLERTKEVVQRIDDLIHEEPGVAHTISVVGQSFALGAFGSNFGQMFVILDDFHERRDPQLHLDRIIARLRQRIAKEVPDANVAVLGPPPVSGLGTSGGFKILIEDRGDLGLDVLQSVTEDLIARANQPPADPAQPQVLTNVFTISRMNSPQLFVDVEREQCAMLGVEVRDVYATLQTYLGSLYVNDFNKFGRTFQVVVQTEGEYRNQVEDIRRLRVRNSKGQMVPLGAVVTVREVNGPLLLTRYNMYPAIIVNGGTAPGVSSGDAIELMQALAKQELPPDMSYEWTEIAYLQLQSGNTGVLIFTLAVAGVFLVLAALYESWTLPLAVILVVPMCLLGSLVGVALSRSDINIFTQIGFVVLVGLASKNAILIVEFAKLKRDAGEDLRRATLEACRLRLRPILMTSFAFILGVLPLMLTHGAGAEMRRTLGTAVFSGMVGVTLFGIFLTPVFSYVIGRLAEWSLFSSPQVRLLIRVAAAMAGVFAVASIELMMVISWYREVLSLGGLVALTAGLVAVILLFVARLWLQDGRMAVSPHLLSGLWTWLPRRQRGAVRRLSGTDGHGTGHDQA